jgi:hypothetical protein
MTNAIYYLSGMNGRLDTGLGSALLQRGFEVTGRGLNGDFKRLAFNDQIDTICEDLHSHFWREDARVIANSFGAYLFLHAQLKMKSYIGKVTLFSPIVGEFGTGEGLMNFIPPYSGRLYEMVHSGTYPTPKSCDVHVGEKDWQSNPENVKSLFSLLRCQVSIVSGAGHSLPKAYVGEIIDKWQNNN